MLRMRDRVRVESWRSVLYRVMARDGVRVRARVFLFMARSRFAFFPYLYSNWHSDQYPNPNISRVCNPDVTHPDLSLI